jgi:hypothetical protein
VAARPVSILISSESGPALKSPQTITGSRPGSALLHELDQLPDLVLADSTGPDAARSHSVTAARSPEAH